MKRYPVAVAGLAMVASLLGSVDSVRADDQPTPETTGSAPSSGLPSASGSASSSPTGTAAPRRMTAQSTGGPSASSGTGSPTATGSATGTPTGDPTASATTQAPAANQPPVAAPDTAEVLAGRTVTVDVLANDTDDGLPDDGTPHLRLVSVDPHGGRFSVTPDGVLVRAADDDRGELSTSYRVSDGELTATGELTVTVTTPGRAVSIHLPRRVLAPHRYHVHGRVRPHRSGPVTVRVQRRTRHGRWQLLGKDAADASGRYAVPFRPHRLRREVFRAVATWPQGRHKWSGRIHRRVHARPEIDVSGPLTRRQVRWSWRPGCPVAPSGLRMIHANRFDYHHRVRRGTMVVAASAATDVTRVLRASFGKHFPFRRMRPTDHFYRHGRRTPEQSDVAAMRAGNTSAFNCRPVTGNPYRLSQHSYGNAVDINTIRNPYVTGSRVYPSWARSYLRRSPYRTGMILPRGIVATTMRRLGWLWGARWAAPDYQHFSSNGG